MAPFPADRIAREKVENDPGGATVLVPDMAFIRELMAKRAKAIREYEKNLKELRIRYLRAKRSQSQRAKRLKKQLDGMEQWRNSVQAEGMRRASPFYP